MRTIKRVCSILVEGKVVDLDSWEAGGAWAVVVESVPHPPCIGICDLRYAKDGAPAVRTS